MNRWLQTLVASAVLMATASIYGLAQIGPLPGMGPAMLINTVRSTWDPANKGANVTLSNGNLDENAVVSSSAWNTVRATSSKSANKCYGEFLVVSADSVTVGRFMIGLQQSSGTLTNYLGSVAGAGAGDQDSSGWSVVSPFTLVNNDAPNYNVVNTIINIAVDGTAGKAWTGKNNTYNGTGNPGAGTNPNITWTPPLALFMAASGFGDAGPAKLRLLTSPASQTYAPPSGFSAWDNC